MCIMKSMMTKFDEAIARKPHIVAASGGLGDGSLMAVTAISAMSGKKHSMLLAITEAQVYDWAINGATIQDAMPHLSPEEREFLITGITQSEWDSTFPETEDE